MLRLRDQGVHNIELVTPTHFTRVIAEALDGLELGIPVVWNSSGYESVETLRLLDGLVQVYMPDLKYLFRKPPGAIPPRLIIRRPQPRPSTKWCGSAGHTAWTGTACCRAGSSSGT